MIGSGERVPTAHILLVAAGGRDTRACKLNEPASGAEWSVAMR